MAEVQTTDSALWGVRKSQRYHMSRVRFFTYWERAISCLTVISGTAVAASIIASAPQWVSLLFVGAITALQAIDLVVGIGARARLHIDLYRRFVVLERDYIEHDLDDRKLTSRRLEIEADEPPALRWLNIICHNDLSISMYGEDANTYKVGWWARRFAHWFDFGAINGERS